MLFVLLLCLLIVQANLMDRYCHNEEYYGNEPHEYPHLHCGEGFITLSLSRNEHRYFFKNGRVRCKTVWDWGINNMVSYSQASDPQLIKASALTLYRELCTHDSAEL